MLVSNERTTPLANLMEAVSAAADHDERRDEPRRANYRTRALRVEVPGSFIPPVFRSAHWRPASLAKFRLELCDVSERGLGTICRVPLGVGSQLVLSGELHSVDTCLDFQVPSYVVHCLCCEDSSFRIGWVFSEEPRCEALTCAHQQGFSLDLD